MSDRDQLPTQATSLGRTENAIEKATRFCLENHEKPVTAAKIYGVKPGSVRVRLHRHRNNRKRGQRQRHTKRGGHNKVLREEQELALFRYMTDEANEGLGVTKQILFAIICHLRRKENKSDPSWRWFQKWLKSHKGDLRVVKTESHTDGEKTVQERRFTNPHGDIDETNKRNDIRARQLYNFDETGVRVSCAGSKEVLVPNLKGKTVGSQPRTYDTHYQKVLAPRPKKTSR